MPRPVDVAVIGDGVVGASITYHLAAAGVDVALLRGGTGGEPTATRHSAGQVRMHHSDPHDAALAALSRPVFTHWAAWIGGDCGFRRTGFAFLVDAAHTAVLAGTVAELVNLGVTTDVRDPADLAGRQPALDLTGVAAVAYEPDSGYADPVRTTTALIERAGALGARVYIGRSGATLTSRLNRITGAQLDGTPITAHHVVLAAGVASAGIAASAGVELPLVARRVGWAVADTSGVAGADRLPMVIDDIAGMYFRPAGPGRTLFRLPLDAADPVAEARARLAPRLPWLAGVPVPHTAAAAEAYTPDGRALIGRLAAHPGLYLATGGNGGGFKTAPAIGRLVASELASGAEPAELKPYRPDRFVAGPPAAAVQRYRHM